MLSLHFLPMYYLWANTGMNFFTGLNQITSITLRGLQSDVSITRHTEYYRNLIRLCLFYDKQTNYYELIDMLKALPNKIKYLEIHCSSITYDYIDEDQLLQKPPIIPKIEYFLFDVNYEFVPLFYIDFNHQEPCYTAAMRFIQTMPNIWQVHLIGRKYNLIHFADLLPWNMLLFKCPKLKDSNIHRQKKIVWWRNYQKFRRIYIIKDQTCDLK